MCYLALRFTSVPESKQSPLVCAANMLPVEFWSQLSILAGGERDLGVDFLEFWTWFSRKVECVNPSWLVYPRVF